MALWLGLAKIGVTVALINYNLRSKSLVHTLTIGECRAVIYALELESGRQSFFVQFGGGHPLNFHFPNNYLVYYETAWISPNPVPSNLDWLSHKCPLLLGSVLALIAPVGYQQRDPI